MPVLLVRCGVLGRGAQGGLFCAVSYLVEGLFGSSPKIGHKDCAQMERAECAGEWGVGMGCRTKKISEIFKKSLDFPGCGAWYGTGTVCIGYQYLPTYL